MSDRANPSLLGGTLADWQRTDKTKDWKFRAVDNGIEAWCGRAGITGNWFAGYVVIGPTRRPLERQVRSLKEAVEIVETRGEELVAATVPSTSKENQDVSGIHE